MLWLFQNFRLVGTIEFGVKSLDQFGIIMPMENAQSFIGMGDEVKSSVFSRIEAFKRRKAMAIKDSFADGKDDSEDEFALTISILSDDPDIGLMIQLGQWINLIVVASFSAIMAIVL